MSQTITQLQQLTDFLNTSLKGAIHTNNIDAWQERGTLIITADDKGLGGYLVAKWKHIGVIVIEKFPHRRINPYNLLALIAAFLIDSNWPRDEYELDDPEIDIDVVSKDNATILIEVQLLDDIELIQDDKGPILFYGERYRVSLVPISIAEDVDVNIKGQS
ncbi:hypothetical protein EXT42_01695 [Pseudoalteromonas sp. CO302Y]|uniref:phage tail protein n=1 Tax=unclassified Pseudoalteromonas TaxID=194690 RepID=UPI001022B005|nr:hypothetical protein EXT42_01695 [Pseudoalteromonas sp. CO302Y]RZG11109.1 hypothetical protein EXT40_01695 [Pseudoalteromonas sp. CO133X]